MYKNLCLGDSMSTNICVRWLGIWVLIWVSETMSKSKTIRMSVGISLWILVLV